MKLSVLVLNTSASVEALQMCLEMLARQSEAAFEILVLSQSSAAILKLCQGFPKHLNLRMLLLEEQDALKAFELGCLEAQGDALVCLQADTLLNPQALQSYAAYLKFYPDGMALGYLGSEFVDAGFSRAPSRWFAHQAVYYLDKRLKSFDRHQAEPLEKFSRYPYWYARTSNFCLPRMLALSLRPQVHEQGIELQDLQQAVVYLAYLCLKQGQTLDLLLDAWAEQLALPETAHTLAQPLRLTAPQQPGRLLATDQTARSLLAALFAYLEQDPQLQAVHKSRFRSPEARVELAPKDTYLSFKQLYYQAPAEARPDFLIIGAQKSGTSSLNRYLQIHPQIQGADVKEVHYFDRDENYNKGPQWYREQFLFEPGKLCFEATASYFKGETCPARIAAFAPEIRLIVLLRDPAERVFSAWNMYSQRQKYTTQERQQLGYDLLADPRSFEQAIADELAENTSTPRGYLERGKYAMQLKYYLKYFRRSQILILNFDQLSQDLNGLLQRCWQFLEINPGYQLGLKEIPIFHKGSYDSVLSAASRDFLREYYAEDKRQLREEFGLDFAWLAS